MANWIFYLVAAALAALYTGFAVGDKDPAWSAGLAVLFALVSLGFMALAVTKR